MDEATRTRIAEKVLHPDTLDHEITPLYTDPSLRWRRTVVLPFGGAYRKAYESFQEVVRHQNRHYEEMEKLKFELAMSALAIVGGSVLTAVFADSALKVAAKKLAVDYVCEQNMQRAFNVMHFVESSAAASFVAGQVWDMAEKAVLDKIKTSLEPSTGNYAGLQQAVQKPEEVEEALEKFNLELRERGIDFILQVKKLNIPQPLKVSIVKKALDSSYLSPPKIEIDKQGLIPKIELTLFMQMLTYSDKVRYTSVMPARSRKGPKVTFKDITVPTTAKNYPTAEFLTTDVVMPGVGNIILEHVDALHAKIYSGASFFTSGEYWDWDFENDEVKSIVSRAEKKLQMLAADGHLGMIARG